jgi:hypothetical protein
MSVPLNLADNLKIGSTQVTAAYLGSAQVWPSTNHLWYFSEPATGTTIKGFEITSPSDSTVSWGDGLSDAFSAPTDTADHTYNGEIRDLYYQPSPNDTFVYMQPGVTCGLYKRPGSP